MWPWNTFKEETIRVLKLDYLMSVLSIFVSMLALIFVNGVVGVIVRIPLTLIGVLGGVFTTRDNVGLQIIGILLMVVGYLLIVFVSTYLTTMINSIMLMTYIRLFTTLKQTGKINMGDLLYVIDCGQTMNVLKVLSKKTICIMLWTLLFIIPGIYKGFQLYMIEYLLAVNPTISYERARDVSIATTDGAKLNLFVTLFVLGIVGSLGGIVAGIGIYFTMPILYIGIAEVCHYLGTKALSIHAISNIELPYV